MSGQVLSPRTNRLALRHRRGHSRSQRRWRPCAFETLEQRRLLNADPAMDVLLQGPEPADSVDPQGGVYVMIGVSNHTSQSAADELQTPPDPRGVVYGMIGVQNETNQETADEFPCPAQLQGGIGADTENRAIQDGDVALQGQLTDQIKADERPIIEYILGSTDEFETAPGRGDSEPVQESSAGPVVVLKSRGSGHGDADARGALLAAAACAARQDGQPMEPPGTTSSGTGAGSGIIFWSAMTDPEFA